LGNGRATVLRFAQEGAKVMAVDHNLSSAEETVAMTRQSDGECIAFQADVTKEATLVAMIEAARRRWGRIDVLHYNVGVSIAGGDAPLDQIMRATVLRFAQEGAKVMAVDHNLSGFATSACSVTSFLNLSIPNDDVFERIHGNLNIVDS
jgi:NAD(P)-dependent dehydrogenase (short-subunit alcohol dehydrogenase family)